MDMAAGMRFLSKRSYPNHTTHWKRHGYHMIAGPADIRAFERTIGTMTAHP